jgi:hypothetical protein
MNVAWINRRMMYRVTPRLRASYQPSAISHQPVRVPLTLLAEFDAGAAERQKADS